MVMGPPDDERTRNLLALTRTTFSPSRAIIYIDPLNPPFRLANVNGSVRGLVELQEDAPSIRICEDGTCGLPTSDLGEARRVLGRMP